MLATTTALTSTSNVVDRFVLFTVTVIVEIPASKLPLKV